MSDHKSEKITLSVFFNMLDGMFLFFDILQFFNPFWEKKHDFENNPDKDI